MHFLQHFSATIRCKLIRFFARKLLSSKNVLILKIVKIFKSSSSLIVRNIFWVILIVVRKMQWVVDAQLQCSWNFVLSAWKWKVISYQGSCLVNIIEASFITKLHCQFFLLFFCTILEYLAKCSKEKCDTFDSVFLFPFFSKIRFLSRMRHVSLAWQQWVMQMASFFPSGKAFSRNINSSPNVCHC